MAPRPAVAKCLKILHRRKRFAAWATVTPTVIRSAPAEFDVEEAQIEIDMNNFQYDKNAFLCKPSTFTTVLPFAELRTGELCFTVERTDQNVAETKKTFGGVLQTHASSRPVSPIVRTLTIIRSLSWSNNTQAAGMS
jgi:hypothetical protein